MKILSLEAENFKRLRVVEITPAGNMVKITGRNSQGKTSVLDAIWSALAGASVSPKAPINDSATEARIRVTMGERRPGGSPEVELIVTRKFKRDSTKDKGYTTSLKVEGNTAGAGPQDYLDSLLSVLTFDPLAFMQMDPRKQFDLFRKFVPDVDFEKIDAQNQIDYSNRTELNRRSDQAKAAAQKIQIPAELPAELPAERVDESALVSELANAATTNQGILTRQSNRSKLAEQNAADKKTIEDLKYQIEALAAQLAANEKRLSDAHPLPALVDVNDLQSRIAAAKQVNAGVEQRELRKKYEDMASDLARQAGELTKAMDARKAEVAAAIGRSKLPVPNVTFGEGMILFKGLPLSQASDAEQIRISAEVAMADSPTLRVIRIRQGSLIDSDGMKILSDIARARDFDVWIEVVDESGAVGFVLEDGMVKKSETAERGLDRGSEPTAPETPDSTPVNSGFPYGKKQPETQSQPKQPQGDLPLDVL